MDWNPVYYSKLTRIYQSHPSWVCGLKRLPACLVGWTGRHTLRGCVDWNCRERNEAYAKRCHTLRGCVDWNCRERNEAYAKRGHTLRGCVDWNQAYREECKARAKSHPCGCVDWNKNSKTNKRLFVVTPFVGVWIETKKLRSKAYEWMSHPSWVCGLKPLGNAKGTRGYRVTPFVCVWIETIYNYV